MPYWPKTRPQQAQEHSFDMDKQEEYKKCITSAVRKHFRSDSVNVQFLYVIDLHVHQIRVATGFDSYLPLATGFDKERQLEEIKTQINSELSDYNLKESIKVSDELGRHKRWKGRVKSPHVEDIMRDLRALYEDVKPWGYLALLESEEGRDTRPGWQAFEFWTARKSGQTASAVAKFLFGTSAGWRQQPVKVAMVAQDAGSSMNANASSHEMAFEREGQFALNFTLQNPPHGLESESIHHSDCEEHMQLLPMGYDAQFTSVVEDQHKCGGCPTRLVARRSSSSPVVPPPAPPQEFRAANTTEGGEAGAANGAPLTPESTALQAGHGEAGPPQAASVCLTVDEGLEGLGGLGGLWGLEELERFFVHQVLADEGGGEEAAAASETCKRPRSPAATDVAGSPRGETRQKIGPEETGEEDGDGGGRAPCTVSNSPPFASNVPAWLKDRMTNDEIVAFSAVMMRENMREADLQFFNDDHLESAGIKNKFTRIKMLCAIKDHFSSQER